jgi:hypothetical protein
MTPQVSNTDANSDQRANNRDGAMWITAIALMALVLIVAGRGPLGADTALAVSNDRVGDMTVIGVDNGSGNDVVIVLDRINNMALVYSMIGRQNLELHQAEPIDRLFAQARAKAASQRPN